MQFRTKHPVLLSLLIIVGASAAYAGECGDSAYALPDGAPRIDLSDRTFTVELPVVPRYSSQLELDSIQIPNGRPIYALFVHGYSQNANLNLILCYNFAKRLMQDGAYVHHAWWNNLCAEYMARPLHQESSYPGHSGLWGMWDGAFVPAQKALPTDDYQFQADAELFLQAIRKHNPSAMIIVVGHSMGGGAVARLGTNTDVVIDILAPLDPVENRSSPWIAWNPLDYDPMNNWTRYRIAREDFEALPVPDPLPRRKFRNNVINLFHRYQMEAAFPMDYLYEEHFLHAIPVGGTSTQEAVSTCKSALHCFGACCNGDGHGEIVGYQGLTINFESYALGLQMRGGWPVGRTTEEACERERLLTELPHADYLDEWKYRPQNPDLCLVSPGLIALYEDMNRPPVAEAGGDQDVAFSVNGVTLDASASSDPDPNDELSYTWQGDEWEMSGPVVTIHPGVGTHEVSLTVTDPSGHIDRDLIEVRVVDLQSQQVTRLVDVHPNPFNSTVQLEFEIADRQHVSLEIFDLQGRLVYTLQSGILDPGAYARTWNGTDDTGVVVSSGCYLVRMQAGDRSGMSKVMLVK